jgi:hypothetical protein
MRAENAERRPGQGRGALEVTRAADKTMVAAGAGVLLSGRAPAPEWRPVPGHEGLYEVSSDGQVRGLDRVTSQGRQLRGRVLAVRIGSAGCREVQLHRDGGSRSVRVYKLVAAAFLGPRPEGTEVIHLDDDRLNDSASNLAYRDPGARYLGMLRRGTHHQAAKTHCPQGHPYEGGNLYVAPRGDRQCRTCLAAKAAERAAAIRAARMPRSGDNFKLSRRRRRPHVENDDYGRFLRRVLMAYRRRIAAGDLTALADMSGLIAFTEEQLGNAARALVDDRGYSWADVGAALGVSRQAARQRWGTVAPQRRAADPATGR